jgi:hypothetical protein
MTSDLNITSIINNTFGFNLNQMTSEAALEFATSIPGSILQGIYSAVPVIAYQIKDKSVYCIERSLMGMIKVISTTGSILKCAQNDTLLSCATPEWADKISLRQAIGYPVITLICLGLTASYAKSAAGEWSNWKQSKNIVVREEIVTDIRTDQFNKEHMQVDIDRKILRAPSLYRALCHTAGSLLLLYGTICTIETIAHSLNNLTLKS